MTNSENKYKNLTEKELRLLITANDDRAIDEHLRRVKSGEIKRKRYTLEQLDKILEEVKKKAS